jgi:lysophospholipase
MSMPSDLGPAWRMELFGSDSNPVPDGAVVGTILTSDGVKLRFARWRTTARRSLGTICLFQGRAEMIEKYFEVVRDLRRRGFAVATFDWRGQGGSERRLRNRRKGHIDSFVEYDRDLDAFMQQVALPDCPPPHYALAHSTGALICLRAARDARARFTRMVLSTPLIELGPTRPSQPVAYRIAAFLTAIGLGELDVPDRRAATTPDMMNFEGNMLTSDPVRFARNQEILRKAPDVGIGVPTMGWLYAACRAMQEAAEPDFGASIRVPILMFSASLDVVVSSRAIEAFAGELRGGAQILVAGARHEIMMERDSIREQFLAGFDAFVPGSSP